MVLVPVALVPARAESTNEKVPATRLAVRVVTMTDPLLNKEAIQVLADCVGGRGADANLIEYVPGPLSASHPDPLSTGVGGADRDGAAAGGHVPRRRCNRCRRRGAERTDQLVEDGPARLSEQGGEDQNARARVDKAHADLRGEEAAPFHIAPSRPKAVIWPRFERPDRPGQSTTNRPPDQPSGIGIERHEYRLRHASHRVRPGDVYLPAGVSCEQGLRAFVEVAREHVAMAAREQERVEQPASRALLAQALQADPG
jgi:hypothetical protein